MRQCVGYFIIACNEAVCLTIEGSEGCLGVWFLYLCSQGW